ncbi:hypothetical protein [Flavobacterium sp.]|uniref:hypothetical protein n=1 Tax=Flavobacterium sp. TaxID=239 RepID=UPI002606528D|nr:hypothetical protein [Flavobacterium sp.]
MKNPLSLLTDSNVLRNGVKGRLYTGALLAFLHFSTASASCGSNFNSADKGVSVAGFMASKASAGCVASRIKVIPHDSLLLSNIVARSSAGTEASVPDTTEIERHRIWLTLQNVSGMFSTLLVGYVTGATIGVDCGYDAVSFGTTGAEFYSIIDGNAYVIQGRPLPFTNDDIVPLGFNATESGTFHIAVLNTDGLFAGDQDILIRDNVTGITNSIKTVPYTFTSETGVFDNRFEMAYTDADLSTTNAFPNAAAIYSKDGTLFVQSPNQMKTVRLFDMQGRLLSENKNIGNTYVQLNRPDLRGKLLIVQVVDEQDKDFVKKIIL